MSEGFYKKMLRSSGRRDYRRKRGRNVMPITFFWFIRTKKWNWLRMAQTADYSSSVAAKHGRINRAKCKKARIGTAPRDRGARMTFFILVNEICMNLRMNTVSIAPHQIRKTPTTLRVAGVFRRRPSPRYSVGLSKSEIRKRTRRLRHQQR